MINKIKRWWNGTDKVIDSDFIIGVETVHSPSAKAARAVVFFYLDHWQWLWGTMIALAALCLTFLKA